MQNNIVPVMTDLCTKQCIETAEYDSLLSESSDLVGVDVSMNKKKHKREVVSGGLAFDALDALGT